MDSLNIGSWQRAYPHVLRQTKVLHLIGGAPMLARVIATARSLNPARLVVVYGFGGIRSARPSRMKTLSGPSRPNNWVLATLKMALAGTAERRQDPGVVR
jgi:CTP:molybdopterin cytidylyltransferase MocA